MSTEEQAPAAEEKKAPEEKKTGDPIRKITRIVLALLVVYLAYYILADRQTPYSDQGRVQALVTPVVPRVAGHLTEIDIRLHSVVEEGDRMFVIDKRPYELAVLQAEANLDVVGQQVGAQTASVKSETARVGVSRAQLDRAQRNYARTTTILENNPGALSQADKDRAETALDQAIERLASSEASLERAQEQLGVEGSENAQLRVALAVLEQAQLDLAFTDILAPDHGIIESFNVSVGHFAQAGAPLATFVSHRDQWIVANMKENNLENIEIGDPVEFVLDVAPGRVFKGHVRSVGPGVNTTGPTNRGELPAVGGQTGWLRDPQRFPVLVGIDSEGALPFLRPGGQVDVVVFSGNNFLLNTLARIRIRITGLISYVR